METPTFKPKSGGLSLLRATPNSSPWIASNFSASTLIPYDESSPSPSASERGLWHDWWFTTSAMDLLEREDPSSSHYAAFNNAPIETNNLIVTIDVTWLGPTKQARKS